jgi:protoporphyrinogen oxidase
VALAAREIGTLGLGSAADVLDGTVVRQPLAYTGYDGEYQARVETLRRELLARYPTFHPVGRNGMHKYNNQDHAMMTAMLTVENILAGAPKFDTWQVNDDAEYHEAGLASSAGTSGVRQVPARVAH